MNQWADRARVQVTGVLVPLSQFAFEQSEASRERSVQRKPLKYKQLGSLLRAGNTLLDDVCGHWLTSRRAAPSAKWGDSMALAPPEWAKESERSVSPVATSTQSAE